MIWIIAEIFLKHQLNEKYIYMYFGTWTKSFYSLWAMMLSHIYSIAICQFWAIKIDKILLLPYKSSSIWHFCYSLLVTNEKRYFLLGECWKRFLLWNLNKFCALKKSGYGEKIGQSECLFHVCWFKRLRFSCWKIIHRQKFIWNISYRWMWIELVPSMDKRRKRKKTKRNS